jgi:hypothetical protein
MILNRKIIAVLATSLALVAPLALKASPVPGVIGAPVIATGGDVKATFIFQDAGDTDDLYLSLPTAFGPSVLIFDNHGTPIGTVVDLGVYAANTELVFKISNVNTGTDLFSGDPNRSPDHVSHASVETLGSTTFVYFEDLMASEGGDFDYNDLEFSFTNTRGKNGSDAPDATGTAGLMLAGLALVGAAAFKRRR